MKTYPDIQFSDDLRPEELMPWSMICLRKHRMRKKFVRHYYRYLPRWVRMQYLGKVLTVPIRRALKEDGFIRRILSPMLLEFSQHPEEMKELGIEGSNLNRTRQGCLDERVAESDLAGAET